MGDLLLWLDDKKVHKFFGLRPSLGLRITPFTMTRFTGIKWKQWSKKWVPAEQTVSLVIALEPLKPGLWKVKVDPRYKDFAVQWLLDNVGERATAPRRHSIKQQRPQQAQWVRSALRSARRGNND